MAANVNFLLYTPLLAGAASGSLEPRHELREQEAVPPVGAERS